MPLQPGEPAPWFTAPTPSNPRYEFHMVAGRFVLLAFLPSDEAVRADMLRTLQAHDDQFHGQRLALFGVLRDAAAFARAKDRRALRWMLDADGAISAQFGAVHADGGQAGLYVLLDPTLRVLMTADHRKADALFAVVRALPAPAHHAGTPIHAPVLIVPRVFEPDFCRALIEHYDAMGGERSGTMRTVNGETVLVVDDYKNRSDVTLPAGDLAKAARHRIERAVAPEIAKAFQFEMTRVERYLVACYDADTGGYFRPHRDNTTPATAHRKFACSINLNAEDFEGGDLRFPEFGPATYRPPTGGAVVFSCSLMHEATPVTRGRRYAFLPFFYDEVGAQIRAAYLAAH